MLQRVVVTGLGAVTPLGVGVKQTWNRLLAGETGIVSVANWEPASQWKELTSTVAGLVPARGVGEGRWNVSEWLTVSEQRQLSKFTQYAMAASEMALKDASWAASSQEDREETGVCLGSGIGNLEEMYDTSLTFHQKA